MLLHWRVPQETGGRDLERGDPPNADRVRIPQWVEVDAVSASNQKILKGMRPEMVRHCPCLSAHCLLRAELAVLLRIWQAPQIKARVSVACRLQIKQ